MSSCFNTVAKSWDFVPVVYNAEDRLKYKKRTVRGHELEIREQLKRSDAALSERKRNTLALAMAYYPGGLETRYQPLKPLAPPSLFLSPPPLSVTSSPGSPAGGYLFKDTPAEAKSPVQETSTSASGLTGSASPSTGLSASPYQTPPRAQSALAATVEHSPLRSSCAVLSPVLSQGYRARMALMKMRERNRFVMKRKNPHFIKIGAEHLRISPPSAAQNDSRTPSRMANLFKGMVILCAKPFVGIEKEEIETQLKTHGATVAKDLHDALNYKDQQRYCVVGDGAYWNDETNKKLLKKALGRDIPAIRYQWVRECLKSCKTVDPLQYPFF